jgi:hypothetical protein
MGENMPTLEEWRRLYDAAIRVKGIAPWEWMTEKDVFGVRIAPTFYITCLPPSPSETTVHV